MVVVGKWQGVGRDLTPQLIQNIFQWIPGSAWGVASGLWRPRNFKAFSVAFGLRLGCSGREISGGVKGAGLGLQLRGDTFGATQDDIFHVFLSFS